MLTSNDDDPCSAILAVVSFILYKYSTCLSCLVPVEYVLTAVKQRIASAAVGDLGVVAVNRPLFSVRNFVSP
jgi:hypothetical protein